METSERLAAQAAAYVKKSGHSHVTSNLKFKRREHLAIQPGFRSSDTPTPVRTELIESLRVSSSCGLCVEGEEKLKLVQILLSCVKICRTACLCHSLARTRGASALCWIGLPSPRFLSQTRGASALCWIDLPSPSSLSWIISASALRWIDLPSPRSASLNCKGGVLRKISLPLKRLQVPVAQWNTRLSAIEEMRLLSHRFGNEASNRWLMRSHVHRIWLSRLFLVTDDSLTHPVHWPRNHLGRPCGNGCLPNWAISSTNSRQS